MEIMSQCDICSGGCPVNSHRESEWVLSIRIFLAVWTNLKQTAVCYLWKKENCGMIQAWFSSIVWNCLKTYILLNFTELSANNYDQHPLLVNKCKVNSVSRAHCSSTVQFCLIQLAKLFGKNKEKKQLLSECTGLHKLLWGCVRRDIWCKNLPMWCYPLWWSLVNTAESSFSKC